MTERTYGIGLYAPAGFATEPAAIERAATRLRAQGHRVVVDPTCTARWQRFSAPDDERLAAVNRMAGRGRRLAMTARGTVRLVTPHRRLDFARSRARKTLVGPCDFTAFQLAALAHASGSPRRPDGDIRFRL